jgi:hypothetical protein
MKTTAEASMSVARTRDRPSSPPEDGEGEEELADRRRRVPELDQRPLAPMAGHTASGGMDNGVLDRRALKTGSSLGTW